MGIDLKSILVSALRTVHREHRDQAHFEIDVTELASIWLAHNGSPQRDLSSTPGLHAACDSPVKATPRASESVVPPIEPPHRAPSASQLQVPHAPVSDSSIVEPDHPARSASARDSEPAQLSWPSPLTKLLHPYLHRITTQGMLPYIDQAIRALMEHGSHPSLVLERGTIDPEAKDLYSLRESLGRVSLLDHTIHVVEAVLELLQQQYREPESHVPRAVLAALAHDLGKIPAWRHTKMYGKQDHATISAVKLREWFSSSDAPWWLDSVVTAVREHHRRSNDSLGTMLKRADMLAREREVAAATAGLLVQAFPAWMHADRWRELVASEIDMLQKSNQWLAFTHHGVVYAKIDLLLRAARTVMTEFRAVDLLFLADSERERASARLVRWLKEHGWLADEIGDGYYGLPYDIEMNTPRHQTTVLPPHYLVPLKVEAFGSEGVFRERKAGALSLIVAVRKRPLGGS